MQKQKKSVIRFHGIGGHLGSWGTNHCIGAYINNASITENTRFMHTNGLISEACHIIMYDKFDNLFTRKCQQFKTH